MLVHVHALGQLIEDCRTVNGWSYGYIARQSGNRLGRTRVQQLAKDEIRAMPTLRVVEGLAQGLRVPGWVVVGTILESMGYPTRPTRVNIEEAIDSDLSLSDADRVALRGFVAGLRARRPREEVVTGEQEPRTEAEEPAPMNVTHMPRRVTKAARHGSVAHDSDQP